MEYNFRNIEQKWQRKWIDDKVYQVPNNSSRPKCYVLDMFPYPSGAGLHVGHPLGYIASDIYARYKRLKGYNVLHPMGYDAFGLPAEQYAIEHGVHPALSTEKNIATFRKQLDNIGFSFDWSREVRTSDSKYYKWTQWIFLQLFKSWYNRKKNKTESIEGLIKIFEKEGNHDHPIPGPLQTSLGRGGLADAQALNSESLFSAENWKSFDEKTQQDILMEYRIAYSGYGEVNWCEALGTVLANDEVINGVSERGGYPVEKKRLRQWYLRITEYADRLLQGLQTVDFSDPMKEMQSNWIGKSEGAEIEFRLSTSPPAPLQQSWRGETKASSRAGESFLLEEPYPKYNVKDRVQYENARINRKQSTEAEAKLWERLRNGQLGCKFRRQHPVEGFITDFVCLQKGLIVEVDGGYHDTKEMQEYDALRTIILEQRGFTILRFTNEEVLENVFAVWDKIKSAIANQKESKNVSNKHSFSISDEEMAEVTTTPLSISDEEEVVGGNTAPLSISDGEGPGVRCFTTRPDTIFGVDFLVLAPEHELVEQITTPAQKSAVEDYITYVKSRSERERMAEKKISGVFTGAFGQHPFSKKQIPIWISEYVLAGYGTGAIMGVPSGDERDHKFAKHFNIPITNIAGAEYNGEEAYSSKELILENSDFLTGMNYDGAFEVVIKKLEEIGRGKRKVNYKMRDAAFSRQRYWGEPFPIIWKDGIAYSLDESELPLELPYVETYKPGPEGEGPLSNISHWANPPSPGGEGLGVRRETNTMPGYAGSSWYFLRYMDPHNEEIFCDKNISAYWNQVDLYVGGTEHAVGHLLYSRMWTKALYDLGLITFDEPFKRLLNQGMIAGLSYFADEVRFLQEIDSENWVVRANLPYYFSSGKGKKISLDSKVTVAGTELEPRPSEFKPTGEVRSVRFRNVGEFVDSHARLYKDKFEEYKSGGFQFTADILYLEIDWEKDENGRKYLQLRQEVEKMSKSKFNTVNPDDIVVKYGADTFRMYEMFLGPVEMSKPWDTKGIEGVHRFLKKLWRLFYHENNFIVTNEKASPQELKVLHKTIKKIEEDTERFSFNTCVSAFMVCVNELTDLKCHKKEILVPLIILLTPYAPHISCELWEVIKVSPVGGDLEGAVLDASFPKLEQKYLEETSKEYPISVNGKLRTTINIHLAIEQKEVEEIVLQNTVIQKWLEGRPPKKIIFVKNKMVNVVV